MAEAFGGEGDTLEVEFRLRHKRGDFVSFLAHALITRDAEGKAIHMAGFNTDLTTFRALEAKAHRGEKLLHKVIDNSPVAMAFAVSDKAMGLNLELKLFNKRFTETFGYTLNDATHLSQIMELLYPDLGYRSEIHEKWLNSVKGIAGWWGVSDPIEVRATCKDGSVKDMILSTTVADDVHVASFTDITGLKREQSFLAELRKRERESEEKQRASLQQKLQTSVVAAAVAHEINQPLSEILLKSQLALRELSGIAMTDELQQLRFILKGIVEGSQRVEETIEKMRALLRNVPTVLRSINLVDVINTTLLHLSPLMDAQQVNLELRLPNRPVLINGDAGQLQIAFSNLIKNGVDAQKHSSPSQRVMKIELSIKGGEVCLILGDAGDGIPQQSEGHLDQLLTSGKSGGTGIGLYLVRTAVANHGASLTNGKSPLGGAEFRILFPCLPEGENEK